VMRLLCSEECSFHFHKKEKQIMGFFEKKCLLVFL
jgi:hypothetical protein